MKYKVGDRVWIKDMEKIKYFPTSNLNYSKGMEFYLNQTNKKDERFITILSIHIGPEEDIYYIAQEEKYVWAWTEDMIECSEKDYYKRFTPVNSRWEILDL